MNPAIYAESSCTFVLVVERAVHVYFYRTVNEKQRTSEAAMLMIS